MDLELTLKENEKFYDLKARQLLVDGSVVTQAWKTADQLTGKWGTHHFACYEKDLAVANKERDRFNSI